MSLELDHAAYLLMADAGWIDYITPGAATAIFSDGSNTVGATMDHSGTSGGKAVYLSFMADAAGDTVATGAEWDYSQFATLVDSVISYFGAVSPPAAALVGVGSTRFGVASGTNSGTVNATALDGDGTLTSVVVKWAMATEDDTTAAGEQVWSDTTTEAMTAGTGDAYSATITPTGFTDSSTVVYWVEATDNDATTSVSEAGSFWGTDFVSTGAEILYMFDYQTYHAYGPADADSILMANMDAVDSWGVSGVSYDKWEVHANGLADNGTVMSNYAGIVYAGVYDWNLWPEASADHSLTEFVANGGYLFYSSEEVLGVYTGWEDLSFAPGHFVYAVLAVEWVGNDFNYAAVAAYDDGGAGLIDGMSAEAIDLNVSLDYYGSMADLCDPIGFDTPDM
ncbi:MAG TPA: hypothetical protein QF695_16230, partial [Arenicellales bacterium]|nr:hypothetical protein [Arenicellales bacterium]